jgi:hypothetical protein
MKNNKLMVVESTGLNNHILYGDFDSEVVSQDGLVKINANGTCLIKHEDKKGSWSQEHKTLAVEQGVWYSGRQVEYNPITKNISAVWD